MADPFEVRMRFTDQLRGMNASVNSAQKAAYFALKYKDMHEDLHSCILEQLERSGMNTRANIMFFVEHLVDAAQRDAEPAYVQMMQRDIVRVVDAVAPPDGSGAANVKVVRKVLSGLQQKSVLLPGTVAELEIALKERDPASGQAALASPEPGASVDTGETTETPAAGAGTRANGSVSAGKRLDKRQIEQRIEEDRERHKRLKETFWAIPQGEDAEFNRMVDDARSVTSDDEREVAEQAALRERDLVRNDSRL